MDYRLEGLSPRSFEQLIQALALREIGPGVVVFGDGPDGGREATFRGPIPRMGVGDWNGELVVQAKFRQRGGSADDGRWAHQELAKELEAYERRLRKRPHYYLFATNAGLTAASETGSKDKVAAVLQRAVTAGWLRDFDIWDRDKLCRLLDAHADLRQAYAAWITPGDVLASMQKQLDLATPEIDRSFSLFLQKELLADQYANLEQAGRPSEDRIPIARVFVDLPVMPEGGADRPPNDDAPGLVEQLLETAHMKLDPASLDVDEAAPVPRSGRWVVVGGPGQGKTTVGQHICQLFRAALLEDRPTASLALEVRRTISLLRSQCERSEVALPTARRFPLRIVLNEFATELDQRGSELSLMRFIVERIERRIIRDLPIDVFRDWLASYPWLIVLDGLDEVPSSSNRTEMLAAIDEFWVDLSVSHTDVLVVATTRPQGYNDDFAPSLYRHCKLAPLAPIEALGYARQLATARYGDATDRQQRILGRLERAAREDATARLMQSPLQVTIMATLVDQIGEPPQQRWRLFSEYYDVIYKREVEREIAAAKVLRQHKPNVDNIHRRVALVLQIESEVAANTEAHLSRERLRAIIEARLLDEEHSGDELAELCEEILTAATERLVFVVGLESDKIGFELRSLQEFMAAEALMDGSDDVVQRRLRAIAASSAWRNAFLFAAGHCFEQRQHLRDTIHTICVEMNDAINDPVNRTAQAGALLAIDLLDDGLAREQPLYRRLLLAQALRILRCPRSDAHDRLARLCEQRDGAEFEHALSEALAEPVPSSGCWRVIRRLIERDVEWAQELLLARWPSSGVAEAALIDELADLDPNERLADRLRQAVVRHDYDRGEPHALQLRRLATAADSATRPLLLSAARRSGSFRTLIASATIDDSTTLNIVLGSATSRAPDAIVSPPGEDAAPSWQIEAAALNFLVDPTPQRLADAFEIGLASGGRSPRDSLPWPLAACLDWAAEHGDGERLVAALHSGAVGDIGAWRAAERRWRRVGVTKLDLEYSTADGLPFDHQIGRVGFPLTVGTWRFTNLPRAATMLRGWIEGAPDSASRRTVARRLLGFLSTAGWPRGLELEWLDIDYFVSLVETADLIAMPRLHVWEEGFDLELLTSLDQAWNDEQSDLALALDAYGRQDPPSDLPGLVGDGLLIRLVQMLARLPRAAGLWRLAAATAVASVGPASASGRAALAGLPFDEGWEVAPPAALALTLMLHDRHAPTGDEIVRALLAEPTWASLLQRALVRSGWRITGGFTMADLEAIGAVHEGLWAQLAPRLAASRASGLQSAANYAALGLPRNPPVGAPDVALSS